MTGLMNARRLKRQQRNQGAPTPERDPYSNPAAKRAAMQQGMGGMFSGGTAMPPGNVAATPPGNAAMTGQAAMPPPPAYAPSNISSRQLAQGAGTPPPGNPNSMGQGAMTPPPSPAGPPPTTAPGQAAPPDATGARRRRLSSIGFSAMMRGQGGTGGM